MKTSTLSTIALIGLAAVSSPVQLAAQSLSVRVDIPFDFQVGTDSYAAGKYMVSAPADRSIMLRRADGKASGLATAKALLSSETNSKPRLVFRHSGTDYVLSQVWGDSSTGRDLWTPKVKRPVIAKSQPAEEVTLYAAAN